MADNALVESPLRSLRIALGVALVCALLVSLTAVTLRPHYLANLEAERMARLGSILDALSEVTGEIAPEDIESRVVDLAGGVYADSIDAATFDARKAASDPKQNFIIPPEHDVAGIKRRAQYEVVYLVRKADGNVAVVILPVRGVGYQSALYGYLALAEDANEILALKFYEQGETPGLGSRIQEAEWEALWPGKQAFDETGAVSIGVGGRGGSTDQVAGISGATRTSLGVNGLIRFWLSDFGFGPYLSRVRQGEG